MNLKSCKNLNNTTRWKHRQSYTLGNKISPQTLETMDCSVVMVTSSHLLCLVTQSCLTLCDPMDCSPPGSFVHGILHARILEWAAVPSSTSSHKNQFQICLIIYINSLQKTHFCKPTQPLSPLFLETREWQSNNHPTKLVQSTKLSPKQQCLYRRCWPTWSVASLQS